MQRSGLALLISLLWLGISGCASSKQTKNHFFFVQMSDPQFGFFTDNKSFEKETINYTKAIAATNRLKPSFLMVTGDLVNKPFDSAQVNEFLRITKQLDAGIPQYHLAGNHDVGNDPAPSDIETYNKIFGREYYSFTHGSMQGIVLNSLYLTSPAKVIAKAAEQDQWLIKTLEESRGKAYRHKIVFLHHPFFLETSDEPNVYFNIPSETRKKYLDLFKKYGVKYVFAGHYHRNAIGNNADIKMVTTGPVGRPLGQDSSGFRIITIKGKKLSHHYYPLDSIPQKIHF